MATIKFEMNQVENYHTRRASIELTVEPEDTLIALTLAEQLCIIKLHGKPSIKMKEFKKLCIKLGMEALYNQTEEKILEGE